MLVYQKEVQIKHVLNMLVLKGKSSEDLDKIYVDHQLQKLIFTIERYFQEGKYNLIIDWITETVKKEQDLIKKQEEDFRVYRKPSIDLLISKCNFLHSKIINILVDEVDLLYESYCVLLDNNKENAGNYKIRALELAQTFVNGLTDQRSINPMLYDQYISIIQQTLLIFNL